MSIYEAIINDFQRNHPRVCPRCGKSSMEVPIYSNALSREADCYICSSCGTMEAIRAAVGKPHPLPRWYAIRKEVAVHE